MAEYHPLCFLLEAKMCMFLLLGLGLCSTISFLFSETENSKPFACFILLVLVLFGTEFAFQYFLVDCLIEAYLKMFLVA